MHNSAPSVSRASPLVTLEERLLMQAVENLKQFTPGGHELFVDLCSDTHDTLVRLQTLPAQLPVELAVKQEVRKLKLERDREKLATSLRP